MRQIGLVLVVNLGVVSCAHNVPQDRATGPDGRIKGAKPITFENGEAKARGVVTYPGGDRVDWKLIELPEGKRGELDLQLTWQAPRPGLQVAFDIFDQWNAPIVATKASAAKRGRIRTATIPAARGKYYVRVYAPKRGDAGAYKLVASFKAMTEPPPPPDLTVPEPPRLAAVPPPDEVCEPFDTKIKACEAICPEFGAPAGWPGCAKRDTAEKEKAAREAAEKARIEAQKTAPKPFSIRLRKVDVVSDGVNVVLPVGTDTQPKLDTSWQGQVLVAGTNRPLANGKLTIIRVGKTQTLAKSKLTIDQLGANPQVQLSPP